MKKTILIVEDDENIIEGLTDVLTEKDYEILAATNEKTAISCVDSNNVSLVIMDVNLGVENGFDICKSIRSLSDIPILFLTACDSEMELVRGFQAGGDDYITKPFRLQELLVRIQALLRRCTINDKATLSSGELIYNNSEYCVYKNDEPLDLTAIEIKMISLFINQWPKTIEREELYKKVWNTDYVDMNTINVNISRIREKLGAYNGKSYIETVRGIGYRWAIPVER